MDIYDLLRDRPLYDQFTLAIDLVFISFIMVFLFAFLTFCMFLDSK